MVCVTSGDLTDATAHALRSSFAAAFPGSTLEGHEISAIEPCEEEVRILQAHDLLFRAGDPKTDVYRVESGVICVYGKEEIDRPTTIEFLFAGDLVGLGFLETHVLTARAVVETRVTCHPAHAVGDLVNGDPTAEAKLAVAIDREFEARRDDLREAGQRRPVERVAALLTALYRGNVREGRRADKIADFWQCGTESDLLGLSLGDFSAILAEFERLEYIETTFPTGVRLKNIAALEALADGTSTASPMNGIGARSERPPRLRPYSHLAA